MFKRYFVNSVHCTAGNKSIKLFFRVTQVRVTYLIAVLFKLVCTILYSIYINAAFVNTVHVCTVYVHVCMMCRYMCDMCESKWLGCVFKCPMENYLNRHQFDG